MALTIAERVGLVEERAWAEKDLDLRLGGSLIGGEAAVVVGVRQVHHGVGVFLLDIRQDLRPGRVKVEIARSSTAARWDSFARRRKFEKGRLVVQDSQTEVMQVVLADGAV